MRIMITGSAALSPEVHDFIRVCFGCTLLQGYGLTETCSGGTVADTRDIAVSQIGAPLGCNELKLVDVPDMKYLSTDLPHPRGEVHIRGGNITLGYYKNTERTQEAFLEDGWFATGDVGMILPNGTFRIIDRKKNLIKPPHGEYIALEKLESVYRNCPYIETISVYADGSHYHCIAIAYPSKPMLEGWAKSNGVDASNFEKLCKNPKTVAFVLKELVKVGRNLGLKSIETLRNLRLCHYEWTPENQHLTTAMKLNRNVVYEIWRKEIDAMYGELGNVPAAD